MLASVSGLSYQSGTFPVVCTLVSWRNPELRHHINMPGKLLDRILFTCNHEFSWPRRTDDGSYYQVCLHCGVQYRYDWARMRRLDKIQAEAEPTQTQPGKRHAHKHDTRMTWHPRERRLKWTCEVHYRVLGTE